MSDIELYTTEHIYRTQESVKANNYQLAECDICKHKSKVQAEKCNKFESKS